MTTYSTAAAYKPSDGYMWPTSFLAHPGKLRLEQARSPSGEADLQWPALVVPDGLRVFVLQAALLFRGFSLGAFVVETTHGSKPEG